MKELEFLLSNTEDNPLDYINYKVPSLDEQTKILANRRYSQDTKSRKKLSYWAATVVSIYLLLVFVILFFNAKGIYLSDTVLSVLLGTTTLNVLGLMFIVLKGYFKVERIKI